MKKREAQFYKLSEEKQKWLFAGTAVFLFCLSLWVLLYEKNNAYLSSAASNITRNLDKQGKDFYHLLENDNLLRRLATESYTVEDLALVMNKPYSILLYKNNKLVYWNNNQIIPENSENGESLIQSDWYDNYKPGVSYGKFQNAICQLILRQYNGEQASLSGTAIIALFPIKYEYEIENQYLSNSINPLLNAPDNIIFTLSKQANSVRVGNLGANTPLFISYDNNIAAKNVNWLVVVLQLCAILLLLTLISGKAKHILSTRGLLDAVIFFGILLFLIRVITLVAGIPQTLGNYSLFNTHTHSGSLLFSSLGNTLINIALITWFADFIYTHLKTPNAAKTTHIHTLLWLGGSILVITGLTFAITHVLALLVSDFHVAIDLSYLPDFGIDTLVAILIIVLLFTCLFYVMQILGSYLGQLEIPFTHKITAALLLLLFSATLFAQSVPLQYALVPVWVAAWVLLYSGLVFPKELGIQIGKFIAWVLFFSVFAAFFIRLQSVEYEHTQRKQFAEKKSIQENKALESEFNSIAPKIISDDDIISKYFTNKPILSISELMERIDKKYLHNLPGNYNVKNILPFDAEGYCLDPKNRLVFMKEYDQRIGANSINTENNYLYLVSNEIGGYNYLSKLPVFHANDSIPAPVGYLIIELEPKTGRSESVYPELIIQDRLRESRETEDYSYAIYQREVLESNSGSFSYPLSQPTVFKTLPDKNNILLNYNGYSHLVYKRIDTSSELNNDPLIQPYNKDNLAKTIIVSKPDNNILQFMSLFAFIALSSCIVFSILLLYRAIFNINQGFALLQQMINANLQHRISANMLGLVFLTFIVVGSVTIISFFNRSTENHNAQLMQKQKEALSTIENTIDLWIHQRSLQQQLDNSSSGVIASAPKILRDEILLNQSDMTEILSMVSKIYDIDMNLYGKNGKLIASSLPDIFTKGLLSNYIHPEAWNHLAKEQNNQFIQNEQIGSLNYLSAYIPVKNELGVAVNAYLNLPYFARQKVFKRELASFLGSLLSVYMFIFLIGTILAFFTARALTTPLRMISNKLKDIKLGQQNEPLYWPHKDEMGALVEQYNKTMLELEKNIKKLAQTERETAWREMAKQVAHEIKNPLTPMKLNIQHLLRASRDNHPKIKELTEKISRSIVEQIDSLSNIATEFSTFAQMPKPNSETVNLKDVLANVIALYEDSIHIQAILPQTDCMVIADRGHLLRIFTNIIKNAIQAIPDEREGYIIVELECNNGIAATVGITDNGIGISEEKRDKVFAPNFTTKSSGMGLGLSMTKNMVESAKGRIWFTTKENEGTTFFIQIPLSEEIVNNTVPAEWN